ncbi:MAG TPA: L-threonylcarbamoyladenylate synthase [Blastocatellia bacterium]|nr:L-threonylcarbamoyladenylate synthase [Blastocatellia bacterium]
MTEVLQLDPECPQHKAIERAAAIIQTGGLVAFPTETVYGLGADAMNETAVRRIFEAKGRPPDNPLIVHIASRGMLDLVANDISEKAERLVKKFWPGPLTLVLSRNSQIAPSVSAGLRTVAVRMPKNEIALGLIRASATPIAAPSANASGRPSPTSASHVLDDLGGRIDMILDGGTTNIGIESTVLDVSSDAPAILRPGWITREMLSEVIGPVDRSASAEELRRSPGTLHRHYSPRARVVLIERGSLKRIEQLCREHLKQGSVGYIGHTPVDIDDESFHYIPLRERADDYGSSIYASLRELDQTSPRVIIVEGISEEGEGAAVMDRLRRAASEVIVND